MWMTRVSIANPVFATMVMVALCVLGLFSYARLGVEQMPDVSLPVAFVDVAYPGAAPEAVEREVTKLVEEALNGIAGVKRITSRSFEGRSQSSAEFSLNANMGRAMQDVRDRIAIVQTAFPKDAKTPTVARFDGDNSQPAVVLALLGAGRNARELSLLADQTVTVWRASTSPAPRRARCASTSTRNACVPMPSRRRKLRPRCATAMRINRWGC